MGLILEQKLSPYATHHAPRPWVFSLIKYSGSLGISHAWVFLLLLLLNGSVTLSKLFNIFEPKFLQFLKEHIQSDDLQVLLTTGMKLSFHPVFLYHLVGAGCSEILNSDPGVLQNEEPPVPTRHTKDSARSSFK